MAFGYRLTPEEAGLEGVAPVADHRQAVPERRRFLAHSLKEHESSWQIWKLSAPMQLFHNGANS